MSKGACETLSSNPCDKNKSPLSHGAAQSKTPPVVDNPTTPAPLHMRGPVYLTIAGPDTHSCCFFPSFRHKKIWGCVSPRELFLSRFPHPDHMSGSLSPANHCRFTCPLAKRPITIGSNSQRQNSNVMSEVDTCKKAHMHQTTG